MNTKTIILPTAGALGTGTINPQTDTQVCDSSNYPSLTVCADALATTETVGIYILCGNTFKAMTDSLGNVQKLTASIPAIQLVGGNLYGFTKDATASACGVYVQFVGRFV